MIIEYRTVSGVVLDTLTLDDTSAVVHSSTTGRGQLLCAQLLRRLGAGRTLDVLRSWSNGYVETRQTDAADTA